MHWRILQPRRVERIAPYREVLRHHHIADELPSVRVVLPLQRQGLVVDEAARARKPAHLARLLVGGHQFEFKGLESLHVSIVSHRSGCQGRLRRPRYPSPA